MSTHIMTVMHKEQVKEHCETFKVSRKETCRVPWDLVAHGVEARQRGEGRGGRR